MAKNAIATGPAFPGIETPAGGYPGMTLRDYFVAAALPECIRISSTVRRSIIMPKLVSDSVDLAYAIAEAVLSKRAE